MMFVGLVNFTACNGFLETPVPQQALPLEPATYNSPQAIQSALIGAYHRFQDPQLYGGTFILAGDLMSNNIGWVGSFASPGQISSFTMNANTGDVIAMYDDLYRLVNDVNGILAFVDGVPNLSDTEKNRIKGEARFLRGMAYFETIRYFGKPWGTTSATDPGLIIYPDFVDDLSEVKALARSSVADVYTQAINDLTQASTLLQGIRTGVGRATEWAAISALAEIAFQQGRYADAATFTNQIISSNQFSLNSTSDAFYSTEFSPESIMEINMTDQDNPGVNAGLSTFYALGSLGGRADIIVAADLVNNGFNAIITNAQQTALTNANLTATDTRFDLTTTFRGSRFSLKYADGVNNADNPTVYRYAEILLMRAEALARTSGVTMEAVNLLNQIRARAIVVTDNTGATVSDAPVLFAMTDFANAQALIDAIMLERRVELAFEGNRFHDLRRIGATFERGNPAQVIADERIVFPIPQRALDNNSALTQNPGY